MTKIRSRITGDRTTSKRTSGDTTVERNAASGRYLSGSSAHSTNVRPVSDSDLVGSVVLTTPEQVERLGKLRQRVSAKLKNAPRDGS